MYGLPKVFFLLTLLANCLIWSQSRYAKVKTPGAHRFTPTGGLITRALFDVGQLDPTYPLSDKHCLPINFPPEEQCSLVQKRCSKSDTFLSIPYLQDYFCTQPKFRPLVFSALLLWLAFLFSTLGISASDFFCSNLQTLSLILGLDENVAGVTFLAFGNGSPDVFSTFSAMRADSGGLAIGELLGAAAFVTSCVVGSMCIIKPFKVERGPFLRDVGFFTFAVILLLVVLWDSKLEEWEAIGLVILYIFYVIVVVVSSWLERRRENLRRLQALMRDEYREEVPQSPYRDEPTYFDDTSIPPSTTSLSPAQYARSRSISTPGPPRLGLELPPRPHSRSPSPLSSRPPSPSPHSRLPSFSLIGALEFRRVVTSLQHQASVSSLSQFSTPISPYPAGHYHHHTFPRHGVRSRTSSMNFLVGEHWTDQPGLPLDDRSPPRISEQPLLEEDIPPLQIPLISVTPEPPASLVGTETDSQSQSAYVPLTRRQRMWRSIGKIFHILFPTLYEFKSLSVLGKVAAVFAAPAVMALTLTLPVVVSNNDGLSDSREKLIDISGGGMMDGSVSEHGRLVDFEEEGVERTLVAEEVVESELRELEFNKWLMAVQCVLGPMFCIAVLFDGMTHEPWLLLAAGITGVTSAILVAVFAQKANNVPARLARCSMGFVVAIVWIMAIADEVVEVLTTFGTIFGLSDAIIGITIFAMGNSLADLVANMSVAVFAPIMGFSACFGGPMLNILLGIGISGTYVIRQTGTDHYILPFSTTLVITSTGLLGILLATLIFVPWNGYFLPRNWGVTLIVAYTALMIANVVVEITSGGVQN